METRGVGCRQQMGGDKGCGVQTGDEVETRGVGCRQEMRWRQGVWGADRR